MHPVATLPIEGDKLLKLGQKNIVEIDVGDYVFPSRLFERKLSPKPTIAD